MPSDQGIGRSEVARALFSSLSEMFRITCKDIEQEAVR